MIFSRLFERYIHHGAETFAFTNFIQNILYLPIISKLQ